MSHSSLNISEQHASVGPLADASSPVLGIAGGVITHTVKMMQEEGAEKAAVKTKEALPDPVELGKGIAKGT